MVTTRAATVFQIQDGDERTRIADALTAREGAVRLSDAGVLDPAVRHVLGAPGKLLRPMLVLEGCRAAGGDPDRAFPAAVATEHGHIASLVHDDIIDGDGERRGQPSAHAKFGVPAAILTGDLLIFQMFLGYTQCVEQGASPDRVVEAIRLLSETCIELCRGQALEATLVGQIETDEATYLEMIRLKTASVCRAATQIGACLGGGPWMAVTALGNYGEALGMAFQIVDDLLPFTSNDATAGKPLDSDLRNQRITLPLIYALQAGGPSARRELRAIFASHTTDGSLRLNRLLTETGALDRAYACAQAYTDRALAELRHLPRTEARDRLSAMAASLLRRSH